MNAGEYAAMRRVEDWHWWYVGMRHVAASLLRGRVAAGARILDAGCGTGGNLPWLAGFGTVSAIDLAPEAVVDAARRGVGGVASATVEALPFRDGQFDLVTSFDVLTHLRVRHDLDAVREMRRVLVPGGLALVRVAAFEGLRGTHDVAVHIRHRYTLPELRALMLEAGFDVIRATYSNTLLFLPAAVFRLASRWRSDTGRSDVQPVAAPVNAVFTAALRLEASLLGSVDLPFGLSALALARRPD